MRAWHKVTLYDPPRRTPATAGKLEAHEGDRLAAWLVGAFALVVIIVAVVRLLQ